MHHCKPCCKHHSELWRVFSKESKVKNRIVCNQWGCRAELRLWFESPNVALLSLMRPGWAFLGLTRHREERIAGPSAWWRSFFELSQSWGRKKIFRGKSKERKIRKRRRHLWLTNMACFFWQMIVFFSDFMLEILVFEFGDGFFFRS